MKNKILNILSKNSNYNKVNIRMKTAIKIADTMKYNNISKEEFAKLLNVNLSDIDIMLSGTYEFNSDDLNKISKILNINFK